MYSEGFGQATSSGSSSRGHVSQHGSSEGSSGSSIYPKDHGVLTLVRRALTPFDQSNLQHDSYIAQDHLLLALIKDPSICAILKEADLTSAAVKTALEQARGNRRIESKNAEEGFDALNKLSAIYPHFQATIDF